MVQEGYVDKT
ncbi:hypothetical protein Bhyg_11283 [Pseudolycoriella hygida]|uniref:Uncharacterized protein n=1 Tax=Pseudolycoriella hygida TaxID=35572 RepID=A0A9Q0MV32_9DIPT|nr:hypothetical protein Bhyg_11283 [Pseudolycoriella hygida]